MSDAIPSGMRFFKGLTPGHLTPRVFRLGVLPTSFDALGLVSLHQGVLILNVPPGCIAPGDKWTTVAVSLAAPEALISRLPPKLLASSRWATP